MGTKTTDLTRSSPYTYVQTWNNRAPDEGTVDQGFWAGYRSSVTSVNTPNFRKLLKQGHIINNPFDIWSWERSVQPGNVTYDLGQPDAYHVCWSGDLIAYMERVLFRDDFVGRVIGPLMDEAIIKAYAKIRTESVMSGEVLFDLGKTLSMLRSPLLNANRLLHEAWKSARKSYGKTAVSVSKANASAWLEYRYGMRPICMDIVTAYRNSLRKRTVGKVRRVARSAETRSASKDQDFAGGLPINGWQGRGSVSTQSSVSAHAGVIYITDFSARDRLSQDFRLGVDSLAATAWEVIPFSFVADWFVSIGLFIEAHNLPPEVTVLSNWVSVKNRLAWSYSGTVDHGKTQGTLGSCQHKFRQMVRYPDYPLPQLPPIVPMQVPSATRMTDAAALLLNPVLDGFKKLKH